jgi:alanine racemase
LGKWGWICNHKKDKKAKILGSVCMDMLMVDVTEIDRRGLGNCFYESPTVS